MFQLTCHYFEIEFRNARFYSRPVELFSGDTTVYKITENQQKDFVETELQ